MLRARHTFVLCAVFAAAACGRVGVKLRPFGEPDVALMDAGVYDRDAGTSGTSGKPAGAGGAAGTAGMSGASASGSGANAGKSGAGTSGRSAGSGGRPAQDASIPDSSTPTVDANTPSCAGALVFNICWYLGAERQNCLDICAAHGGFDNQSITHIGTSNQGGSRDDCQQIMDALGRRGTVGASQRSDGLGLGCHVWDNTDNYWLVDPRFDPDVQIPQGAPVRMACGCER